MEMTILEETEGHIAVRLVGRLDLQGVNDIELPFKERAACAPGDMIVELSGLDFLASLGMRLLITSAKLVQKQGGRFILVAPQEEVENALKMSGLDQVMPLADTMDEARALVKG